MMTLIKPYKSLFLKDVVFLCLDSIEKRSLSTDAQLSSYLEKIGYLKQRWADQLVE
jgi:hypothetical protein